MRVWVVTLLLAAAIAAPASGEKLDDKVRILTSDDMFAKEQIVLAWQVEGEEVLDRILPLLDHAHRDVRAAVIDTLGGIASERSVQTLVATVRRYGPLPKEGETFADQYLRSIAVQHLGGLGNPQALPVLREVAASPDAYDATWAALSLGRLGEAGGTAQLLRALSHENADIRVIAAGNLWRFPAAETVAALRAAAKDAEWVVRERAAFSLGKLGEGALAKELLGQDPSPFVRRTVQHTLP